MDANVKKLKKLLYLARKKQGLSQTDLANRMEVSKQYISQLESNSGSSTYESLIDALQHLGIDVLPNLDDMINQISK